MGWLYCEATPSTGDPSCPAVLCQESHSNGGSRRSAGSCLWGHLACRVLCPLANQRRSLACLFAGLHSRPPSPLLALACLFCFSNKRSGLRLSPKLSLDVLFPPTPKHTMYLLSPGQMITQHLWKWQVHVPSEWMMDVFLFT